MAAREVLSFRNLLLDLHHTLLGPTRMATDNRSVIDLAFNAVAFTKKKHILRAAEFVRDPTLKRVLELKWIPGHSNPADLLTKPLLPFANLSPFCITFLLVSPVLCTGWVSMVSLALLVYVVDNKYQ